MKIRFLFLTSVICFLTSCHSDMPDTELPNIIIFLVDDMGQMDTSVPFITDANNNSVTYPLNSFYRTPNMELLAQQGVRFSNFYAHSVCSPTRTSILTGQNSARHRVTNWIRSESNNKTEYGPSNWNWKGLDKRTNTFPRLLQEKGYRTIHVGKAHFGPFGSEGADPLNLGFDVNISGSSIGEPGSYYGQDGYGHINGNEKRAVPDLEKYHGQDIFLAEALTLKAKREITSSVEIGQPFFLNLSHYAVHTPFQSDPRFANNYTLSDQSEKAQTYATLIEGIDKSLGDIVVHIENLNIGKNTIILFLGDNGSDAPLVIKDDYSSSKPLKGKKGNHWEGGMRVPFIASWITLDPELLSQKQLPIKRGFIQSQQGSVLDLYPTICNIADIDIPKGTILDGYDLSAQLNGQYNESRDELFLNHFPHSHRSNYFTSLVKSDWKIIYHYPVEGSPRYELYDLKQDPFESVNLADDHPDQLKSMMIALTKELKDKNALMPEKDGVNLELQLL